LFAWGGRGKTEDFVSRVIDFGGCSLPIQMTDECFQSDNQRFWWDEFLPKFSKRIGKLLRRCHYGKCFTFALPVEGTRSVAASEGMKADQSS